MKEFYNRINETKDIIDKIGVDKVLQNKILLIYGKTGVGKSGLLTKILEHDLKNSFSFRVEISKTSPGTIENLHYFNSLYDSLSKISKDDKNNLLTPKKFQIKKIAYVMKYAVKVVCTKLLGDNKFFIDEQDDSIIKKRDYIVYALNKQNYIVDIENIQNIDLQSFEMLKDIVEKTNNSIYIFEYTLDKEHTKENLGILYNELCGFQADISTYFIDKLDFSEAKKLAPQYTNIEYIKKVYENSEGNLIKLILYDENNTEELNTIITKLNTLHKNELFVLNLVYLNGTTVNTDVLVNMILGNSNAPAFTPYQLNQIINNLCEKRLVTITDEYIIKIMHDSIISELENQPISSVIFSAYSVIKEYYLRQLKEHDDICIAEKLFGIFIKFSDPELFTIMPYIKKMIRLIKYPEAHIQKLDYFCRLINSKEIKNYEYIKKIILELIRLAIELGLGEYAQQTLSLIYSEDKVYHRILQAQIYVLNCDSIDAVGEIEKLLDLVESKREELIIYICLLCVKMECENSNSSIKLAKKILNEKEYQNEFEYAFLLRNYAELVDDYDYSLSLYSQALKIFRRYNRNDLCSQVYLSMSMFYAYKGKLRLSKRILEKVSNKEGVLERYILNNEAVLELLNNDVSKYTTKKLCDALLLTNDLYEKLIIESNLLVCYSILGEKSQALKIAQHIEMQPYTKFKYEEFLHIIYTDLKFYYTIYKNEGKIKYYNNKIIELMNTSEPTSMFQRISKNQFQIDKNCNEFYSKFPYRVDFLGNWDLVVSEDLVCY